MDTPEPINLLATNGIVRVAFAKPLTAEQALAILNASQVAADVDTLAESLRDLGRMWRITTVIEVIGRKQDLVRQ